jgi:hypothetical protein
MIKINNIVSKIYSNVCYETCTKLTYNAHEKTYELYLPLRTESNKLTLRDEFNKLKKGGFKKAILETNELLHKFDIYKML